MRTTPVLPSPRDPGSRVNEPPIYKAVPRTRGGPGPAAAPGGRYRSLYQSSARRNLLFGFAATVTLEFLVAWGGNRTHYVPKPVVKSEEQEVLLVMQRVEPDPVEELAEPSTQSEPPEGPAPPMLQDVPQAVTPQSFVQQIEPPPPPITDFSKNIVKIPGNRTSFGKVEILDISQLDKTPIPKFRARPAYPFEMIRAGVSGEVFVDFIVDPNGNVRNAFALRSSNTQFEENAVKAVARWTFIPGQKNGHAVYTHMQVPIRFNLEKTQGED